MRQISDIDNLQSPIAPYIPQPIIQYNRSEPVKVATPDLIVTGKAPEDPEQMFELVLQKIGGHELISMSRSENVNGQNIRYQPIRNIGQIASEYDSKKIIPLPNSSSFYNNSFSINIDSKIPAKGLGFSNNVSVTTRINLVSNPSFEIDMTGWSALSGATISRVTSEHYSGAASARVVATVSGSRISFNSPGIAVTGGQTYTASAWVKGEAGKTLNITTFQQPTSITTSSNNIVMTGQWQRISLSTTMNASTTNASIEIRNSTSGTHTYYVDAVLFENEPTLVEYFDGPTKAFYGLSDDSKNIYVKYPETEDGEPYIIIEATNLADNERIQVEIIKSSDVFNDTIY